MMSEMLITAFCFQSTLISPIYQPACSKATEAGGRQSQFIQNIDLAENYFKNRVTSYTGAEVWAVSAFAYKTYCEKTLSSKVSTKKVLPSYLPHYIIPTYGFDRHHSVSTGWEFNF